MPSKKNDGMYEQYFTLLDKYKKKFGEKVMLFYQVGTFYEVYGLYDDKRNKYLDQYNDSNNLNKILECHVALKKNIRYKGYVLSMAGYPLATPLSKNVPKITELGWTVPVWKQSEENKQQRYEFNIFSAGTSWFNDTNKLSNCFTVLWLEKYPSDVESTIPYLYCGLANIDIFTGKSNLFQFKYSNNKLHNVNAYEDIERFNSIYKPKEIIFIHNYENENDIKDIIQWTNLTPKKIHIISMDNNVEYKKETDNCQKQVYIKDVFRHFFPKYDFFQLLKSSTLENYPFSQYAFCFLLNFLKECNIMLTKNLYTPVVETVNDKLLLATHSLKQLNIINTPGKNNNTSSVINLINKTCTNMGKRKFYQQITHPSNNVNFLFTEYNMIEYILNNEKFIDFRNQLINIKDIEKLYRKTIHLTAKPYQLSNFYNNLIVIEEIKNKIETDNTFKKYIDSKCNIEKLSYSINELKTFFEKYLNFSLCNNVTDVKSEINFFNRGLFPSLDKQEKLYIESCQELETIRKNLTEIAITVPKLATKNSIENDTVINTWKTDKSGVFLKLTNARSTKLKAYLDKEGTTLYYKWKSNFDKSEKTTQIDTSVLQFKSVSGATSSDKKITCDKLTNVYNTILQSSDNLNEELDIQFKKFLKKLNSYFREIDLIIEFVTLIDVILTKAFVSKKYNYCKPIIKNNERSFLMAKDLRHPLVEHINTEEIYTPNDVTLGLDHTGMLVYGTNAVGKTTLIRAIGCNIIMAQAGMFVPSTEFIFCPYKKLFTRILGNDNLFKNLSSYAVECTEMELIVNNCDKNTLILGDELCNGTEIGSAYSIMSQSLIWFNKTQSSHIFATHYHDITKIDEVVKLKELFICHMAIRNIDGLIIYDRKIKEGAGSNSYGLEVLRSFNFPHEFVRGAFKIRNQLEGKKNNSLKKRKTNYNAKKLKGDCEFCNKKGVDVHHLTPQQFADKDGFIKYFNKNHVANLANVCTRCHDCFTRKGIIHQRKKTIGGKVAYSLVET
tara:strand:- start:3603 stop:6623 length:3021 start_codon:yes stop_codon:yes gene_type:complete